MRLRSHSYVCYFESQWLEDHFNKWQIFRNSPGFANTNSNIESFNATFKRDFTKRIKGSIISSCNKLFNCIIYYSNPANNQWNNSPAFDQVVRDQALKISSTCFTKQGNSGRKFRYRESLQGKFVRLKFGQMTNVVIKMSVATVHHLLNGRCVHILLLIVTHFY